MDERFKSMLEDVHEKYTNLINSNAYRTNTLPRKMPKSGVYLFSENGKYLYVGRSNNMRSRYGNHCNKCSSHNSAAFAFKIARETTGKNDNRKQLVRDDHFLDAFEKAKLRIQDMDYRFVEEDNQIKQSLLEIYCAVILNTPYNDFHTH